MGMGGGGQSGRVDYPAYMKEIHEDWLHGAGTSLTTDITAVMNSSIGNSPFTAMAAYDPTADMDAVDTSIATFETLVNAMNYASIWPAMFALARTEVDDHLYDDADIAAEVAAFSDEVDAEYESVTKPRFQKGMQDINAVVTSSYVIGLSNIEREALRQKARFSAQLRLQNHKDRNAVVAAEVSEMVKLYLARYEYARAVMLATSEAKKMRIIAEKEAIDQDYRIEEADAKWDLEVFQYGGNLLASIGSASVRTGDKMSPFQSALSGVMSGLGAIMTMAGGLPLPF